MRLIGILLLLVGAWLAAHDLLASLLPQAARIDRYVTLPSLPVSLAVIGGGLALVGLALAVVSRRRAPELDDAPIRRELVRRGLMLVTDVGGWRADGSWDGVVVQIRRVSGFEASRFGRPWVIEVSVRGRPREPWPLVPDEGKVVDVRDHGFSATIPALSRPDGQARTAELIGAVVACVQR